MCLAIALPVILTLISSVPARADTIHVPADQPTIQAGIDAANDGDLVLVAPGTYVENILFNGKAISVESSSGAEFTVIDAGNPPDPDFGSAVSFIHSEGPDSVIDGFTLTNGKGTYFSNYNQEHFGGGVYSFDSSPTIINNIISGNDLPNGNGGGIACLDWHPTGYYHPTIKYNIISGNSVSDSGGGIFSYYCAADISSNVIINNQGEFGGGICCTTRTGSKIMDNTLSGNQASTTGGGLYLSGDIYMFMNNTFENNSAAEGGGAYCSGAGFISNNTFFGNQAHSAGGGLMLTCESETKSMVISNNVFQENHGERGGGFFVNSWYHGPYYSLLLTNNTFVGNSAGDGGGLYFDYVFTNVVPLEISNSIIWNNSAYSGPAIYLGFQIGGAVLTVKNSNVQGGKNAVHEESGFICEWGRGMIDADPLLVDPDNRDCHLTWRSPCINRGINDGAPSVDMDGEPRPFMGTVDMGADEFTGIHPLSADTFTISRSAGGLVNFVLDADSVNAGIWYCILGSRKGTTPGFKLPSGARLPLKWDGFTNLVIVQLNTARFIDFLGVLDGTGSGSAQLHIQPGEIPFRWIGTTMHFAYALDFPFEFVSNPMAVKVVP